MTVRTLQVLFRWHSETRSDGQILAYHDRSDGGLWATLMEMAFAGRTGLNLNMEALGQDLTAALFCEELGGVVQVSKDNLDALQAAFAGTPLRGHVHVLGICHGLKHHLHLQGR